MADNNPDSHIEEDNQTSTRAIEAQVSDCFFNLGHLCLHKCLVVFLLRLTSYLLFHQFSEKHVIEFFHCRLE